MAASEGGAGASVLKKNVSAASDKDEEVKVAATAVDGDLALTEQEELKEKECFER